MTRLLWKEIRSSFWWAVLAWALAAAFIASGDPYFFRTNYDSAFWTMLVFLVMGLRAYSGELAADTARFVYSQPVPWWRLLLAKLLSAIIAILSTLVVAAVFYAIFIPGLYRPFLGSELWEGALEGVGLFAFGYLLGFGFSALLPGLSGAFAAFVGGVIIATGVGALGDVISRRVGYPVDGYVNAAMLNACLLGLLGAVLGTALIARKLPALDAGARWRVWMRPVAAGILLGIVLAIAHVSFETASYDPPLVRRGLSPDGRWALYYTWPKGARKAMSVVLVDLAGDRKLVVPLGPETIRKGWAANSSSWSQDSSKLAILTPGFGLEIVEPAKSSRIRKSVSLDAIDRYRRQDDDLDYASMKWDPAGNKIAISGATAEEGALIAVVDVASGRTTVIERPESASLQEGIYLPPSPPILDPRFGGTPFWPPGWPPPKPAP